MFSPNIDLSQSDFLINGFTVRLRKNFVFYLYHFEIKTFKKAENKNCTERSKA